MLVHDIIVWAAMSGGIPSLLARFQKLVSDFVYCGATALLELSIGSGIV
jgi:hypothetical protein